MPLTFNIPKDSTSKMIQNEILYIFIENLILLLHFLTLKMRKLKVISLFSLLFIYVSQVSNQCSCCKTILESIVDIVRSDSGWSLTTVLNLGSFYSTLFPHFRCQFQFQPLGSTLLMILPPITHSLYSICFPPSI